MVQLGTRPGQLKKLAKAKDPVVRQAAAEAIKNIEGK